MKVTSRVTKMRCRDRPAMRQNSTTPWYRKAKNCWYAWVNGRQVSLAVKGREKKKAAHEAYHRLLAAGNDSQHRSEQRPKGRLVTDVVEVFLADAERRVTAETLAVWRSALTRLAREFGTREAETLKSFEVERFAAKPGLSDSTTHSILSSVITAFRWAARAGILSMNPLTSVRKPPMRSRGAEAVLSRAEFDRLLDAASNTFRPFLLGLWLTGCRPGELSRLEVRDVDFGNSVAILARHKTAGKTGKPRLIFLSPAAHALFKSQAEENPNGLLFRNKLGRGFNRYTLFKAMVAARKKANLPNAICYSMRHSFATDALAKGVPDATVAALLGHSSTVMLHKHYSHLTSRAEVLRTAAAKVR